MQVDVTKRYQGFHSCSTSISFNIHTSLAFIIFPVMAKTSDFQISRQPTFSAQANMTSSSNRSASYMSLRMMGTRASSWTWCSFTTHSKPPSRYFWAFLLLWQNWGDIKTDRQFPTPALWPWSPPQLWGHDNFKENNEVNINKTDFRANLLEGSAACTSWFGHGCFRQRAAHWGWGGPWPSHPDAPPPPISPYQSHQWSRCPSCTGNGKTTSC